MNTLTSAAKKAHSAVKIAQQPFETLNSQLIKPMAGEFAQELGSLIGTPRTIGSRPRALAQEDLARARQEEALQKMQREDDEKSAQYLSDVKQEYSTYQIKSDQEQSKFKEEVVELQEEVAKLAKSTGVETKVYLQNPTKKVGPIDIKFLTSVIRFLRLKTQESKSAKDLVSQRQNAKPATGMLAWVSGKQMKVHEQGTLQLQG